MTPRLSLLLTVCLLSIAGCLGTSPAIPPAKAAGPQAAVFEGLAKAVESGAFADSSQRFVKVAGKTLKAKGLKPPAGYDAALTPWLKNHKPSAAEAADLAAKLRGMKDG